MLDHLGVERHGWTLCNEMFKFSMLVDSCVLVLRSESLQVNTAPLSHSCGSAAAVVFEKRTGMFSVHCVTP